MPRPRKPLPVAPIDDVIQDSDDFSTNMAPQNLPPIIDETKIDRPVGSDPTDSPKFQPRPKKKRTPCEQVEKKCRKYIKHYVVTVLAFYIGYLVRGLQH